MDFFSSEVRLGRMILSGEYWTMRQVRPVNGSVRNSSGIAASLKTPEPLRVIIREDSTSRRNSMGLSLFDFIN